MFVQQTYTICLREAAYFIESNRFHDARKPNEFAEGHKKRDERSACGNSGLFPNRVSGLKKIFL